MPEGGWRYTGLVNLPIAPPELVWQARIIKRIAQNPEVIGINVRHDGFGFVSIVFPVILAPGRIAIH